jgi:hypothetical protein
LRSAIAEGKSVLVCLESQVPEAQPGLIGHQTTWKPTDNMIAGRDDVIHTGLHGTRRVRDETDFTSSP